MFGLVEFYRLISDRGGSWARIGTQLIHLCADLHEISNQLFGRQ